MPADRRPTEASFSARMISVWAFFNSALAVSSEATVARSFSFSAESRRRRLFSEVESRCSSLSSLRTAKTIPSSSL